MHSVSATYETIPDLIQGVRKCLTDYIQSPSPQILITCIVETSFSPRETTVTTEHSGALSTRTLTHIKDSTTISCEITNKTTEAMQQAIRSLTTQIRPHLENVISFRFTLFYKIQSQ